jgi:putative endonuclease
MSLAYDFGKQAELFALNYLEQKGYQLLAKNYRYKHAEIDLLMQKNKHLICIEVKARSTSFFGEPESFINSKKIKNLVLAVNFFIEEHDLNLDVRFDIVALIKSNNKWQIKHLKNAFYAWE